MRYDTGEEPAGEEVTPLITHRKFAQSSALLSIQEIKAEPGSKLKAAIDKINALYPPEIIEHYKPETVTNLLSNIQ